MAALRDDIHDRSLMTNVAGILTAVALAMILLIGILAVGAYAVSWAWALGG